MLLDIEQRGNKLVMSYYDKEGKTAFKKYEFKEFENWVVCSDRDKKASQKYTNWDGRPVKKIKAKRLDKYSIIEFMEFLPKGDKQDIFGYNLPKKYFIDIEVEVSDTFPEPSIAPNPVTTICIVTPENKVVVLGLNELMTPEQLKIQKDMETYFASFGYKYSFNYKKFNSEVDLLYTFFKSFVSKMPMMSGWNVIGFDWTYLINRAKRLGIDPTVASPAHKLEGRDLLPLHVGVLDYLELYKKWDRTVAIKENYKLDTVANAVLGVNKIKYDGTLQDLYENDFTKYVYYNVVDTILVQLIDRKISTMEIALTLANICKIGVYKASSPVTITESLLCRKFLEQNKVMAKDWDALNNSKGSQYAGAYVKKPKLGMHKAVAALDYASLYPSVMMQMNISPDSFITKLDADFDKIRPEIKDYLGDWNNATMSKEERQLKINSIEEEKIIAINGSVYKKEQSILKTILIDLYAKRKKYKKQSFLLKQKAYELERSLDE